MLNLFYFYFIIQIRKHVNVQFHQTISIPNKTVERQYAVLHKQHVKQITTNGSHLAEQNRLIRYRKGTLPHIYTMSLFSPAPMVHRRLNISSNIPTTRVFKSDGITMWLRTSTSDILEFSYMFYTCPSILDHFPPYSFSLLRFDYTRTVVPVSACNVSLFSDLYELEKICNRKK